jgi:DDE superfamily endonuclease
MTILNCRGKDPKTVKKVVAMCILLYLYDELMRVSPTRRRIRISVLSGRTYCNELLSPEGECSFHETTRMYHGCFHQLLQFLRDRGLTSTRRVKDDEKLIMFMYMLTGKEYRCIAERFQHSISTVSSTIHEVLDVFDSCLHEFLVPPSEGTPSQIADDPKFKRYFKNCIGAIDGTLIPAFIKGDAAEQKKWRCRKGFLSQNVLVACNFDMTVSYILAGWSGCAHDSKVLADAFTKGFVVPHKRYYVGDAGYGPTNQN